MSATRTRRSFIMISVVTTIMVLTSIATAQKADRDVIEITKKRKTKSVACTVLYMNDEGRLVYTVKGKTKSVHPSDVVKMVTVDTRLTDFFAQLDELPRKDVAKQWPLAEWARDNGLPEMYRLQAYRCLDLDSAFAPAHKALRHKKRGKSYKWRQGKNLVSESEFRKPRRGRNDFPWFESPHFRVRSSGSLGNTIGNVFDLERVRLQWKDDFANDFMVADYQPPLGFEFGFIPKKSTTARPYFDPHGDDWRSYTDYADPADRRPRDLFSLLTQQLMNSLYAPLSGIKKFPPRRLRKVNDRNAVWLELGFGWWYGGHFTGEPGYAKKRNAPTISSAEARRLLGWMNQRRGRGLSISKWKDLPNLIGRHFNNFYAEGKNIELLWLASQAFVTFLMADATVPDTDVKTTGLATKNALIDYIAAAYRSAKGNSSRLFDKKLGTKVERLEKPFRDWIAAIADQGR